MSVILLATDRERVVWLSSQDGFSYGRSVKSSSGIASITFTSLRQGSLNVAELGSDLSIKHWYQKRGQPIAWFGFQVDWLSRGRVIKSHAAQITGRISRCHVSYHEQRRQAGDHFYQ